MPRNSLARRSVARATDEGRQGRQEAGDAWGERSAPSGSTTTLTASGTRGRRSGASRSIFTLATSEPALRRDHRGRRLGARLGHRARRDPRVRDGRDRHRPALGGARALHGRGDPPRGRHRRPAPRRRRHAVPHAVPHPPRRDPPVPHPADGVAPAPPDRPAAVQRLLRRRGRLGADHAAADGGRHRRDDGRRGGADVRRRPRAGHGRAARLPGRHRRPTSSTSGSPRR